MDLSSISLFNPLLSLSVSVASTTSLDSESFQFGTVNGKSIFFVLDAACSFNSKEL